MACAAVVAIAWLVHAGISAAAPLPRSIIRPWQPPNADSMIVWAAEAKVRFQANTGDTVGGRNFRAYDLVGSMGRRLVASLGRDGMLQAQAVAGILDSLGLDTEIAFDPQQPHFCLLVVRNPYHPDAEAVGWLYWFRDRDLKQQGVVMKEQLMPRMRVWWRAGNEAPYECDIVSESHHDHHLALLMMRLNETATYWVLIQYGPSAPDLGGAGEALWAEVNRAGAPELLVWTHAEADSTFEECTDCPHLIRERMFVEGPNGYDLYDSRLVPSPYTVFTLFIRLLQRQDRGAASRLLETPARVADAIAEGWARRGRGVWNMEYAEEGRTWPDWFEMRFAGPHGPVHYIVHFVFRDGHWLIANWMIPRVAVPGKAIRP